MARRAKNKTMVEMSADPGQGPEQGGGACDLAARWVPLESDLQNFLALCREAAVTLGHSPLQIAKALVSLSAHLRQAGAGCGKPLFVTLHWSGSALWVDWEGAEPFVLVRPETLDATSEQRLLRFRQQQQRLRESQDPELLRQRNQRMTAYFETTREQLEAQLTALHEALQERQLELTRSIIEAETDALTGARNRRAFDAEFPRAFRRAITSPDNALTLLLVDLDHFKAINDTHGHRYGDDYLRDAAHAMQQVIRTGTDQLYRIGGDEFAILLFAAAPIGCAKAADILARMERRVSIGLASVDPQQDDLAHPEALQERADQALYAAKEAGRGQFACAPDCCRVCSNAAQASGATAAKVPKTAALTAASPTTKTMPQPAAPSDADR
ncbi:hypothetical protein CKO15_08930 [Halorhodospira abdelmalekii]|uniref:GGDEF domain-containing protein n=1 Tax=Halorhodospira abdelmalekii TaxID=421629 RepID=UPI0019080A64|nr:GGDEF domain-containing protein [Halorhodospira abdelmalekii]MBK1735405.1 hypothetical protein [Halorhodospira abdelmalekii]